VIRKSRHLGQQKHEGSFFTRTYRRFNGTLLVVMLGVAVVVVPADTALAQDPPCNFTYNSVCYADLATAEDAMRLSSPWNLFMTLKEVNGNQRTYHLPPKPTLPNPVWITRTVDNYVHGWRGDVSPKFATQAETFEWAEVAARRLFAPGLSSVKSAYISDDLMPRGTQTDVDGFEHYYYSHNYTRVPILEIDLTQTWPVHWACSFFTPGVEGARVSSYFHSVEISDQAPTPEVYYIAGQGCGTFNGARYYMIAFPVLDIFQIPNSSLCQAPYSHDGTECVSSNEEFIYAAAEYVLEPAEQCFAGNDTETNPCDPANGNKSQVELDYAPSVAGSLAFQRFYNSMGAYRSGTSMAPGWRHSYSSTMNEAPDKEPRQVFVSSATRSAVYSTAADACSSGWGDIKDTVFSGDLSIGIATYAGDNTCDITIGGAKKAYLRIRSNSGLTVPVAQDFKNITRANGATLRFELENGVWVNKLNASLTLEELGGNFVFTDTNDTKETFNASGQLISITYRNGQTETVEYNLTAAQGGDDDGSTLDRVTGPFGHALTLSYDADSRLANVVTPDGTVQYTYNTDGNLESVINPDASVRQYHYEDTTFPDHLTGITDEGLERFATWSYDAEGRAVTSEHAGGKEFVQLTYNANGTTTLTTGNGAVRIYTYSTEQGRRKLATLSGDVCSTCPGGNIASKTYDANGFLDEVIDWEGNTTQTVRNSVGLVEILIEGVGSPVQRTTTTTWHPTLRVPAEVVSPKNATNYTRDANGNILTMTISSGPLSRSWAMTYNADGQLLSINGPRTDAADVTSLTYYTCSTGSECGQLQTVTNAMGHVTTYNNYDAVGRATLVTDANGLQSEYTYDWRGNVLTVVQSPAVGVPRTTTMTYDDIGQLETLSTPDGMVLTYTYSAAQYLTSVADSVGNRIDYDHDAMGNLIDEDTYDTGGQLKRAMDYAYDLNSRLDSITNGGNSSDLNIDAVGNLVGVIDAEQASTTHIYDALNRLDSTIDALTGVVDYVYDDHDNITTVAAPNGATTNFVYDDLDNLTQEVSPDRGLTTYTYDEAGNRLTETDARGVTTTYAYDALNRMVAISYPDSSLNVTFAYDQSVFGVGRRSGMLDASGTTTFSYDGFGNLATDQRIQDGYALSIDYGYDNADRISNIVYPSGKVVSYVYDTAGQVEEVTLDDAGMATTLVSNVNYLPFGPLVSLDYGNGLSDARNHDLAYRLTNQTTSGTQSRLYVRDSVGNVTALTDLLDSQLSQSFIYDDIYRLDTTQGDYGDLDYGYDPVGNRLLETHDSESTSYSYEPNSNRLNGTNGSDTRVVAYDAMGNITAINNRTLSYADHKRLTEVRDNSVIVGTYTYNGNGQRTKKSTDDADTYYMFGQTGELLAEFDGGGTVQREYVYLSGQPLAILDNSSGLGNEVIVDNSDPGVSTSGTWNPSTSVAGFEGSNYLYHAANGSPSGALVADNTSATFTGAWPNSTSVSGYLGSNYQYHAAQGPLPGAVVVDNDAASYTGTWPTSTSVAGYQGNNYQYHAAGTGANAATWSTPVGSAGDYTVYARWTSHPNRATDATYTISHAGGGESVTVNQALNGGEWVPLATYNLQSGTLTVTLNDQANGYVIADAIMVAPVDAEPNTATWSVNVPVPEFYDVYARWTAHPNRASDATYIVDHAGGTAFVSVNQQQLGGQWQLLGNFNFDAGNAIIELTDDANGYVIADAVMLVPTSAPQNQVVWDPELSGSAEYEVYARWTAHPNRATNATYTINHSGGNTDVSVNQQASGGAWNLLATATLTTDSTISLTDQADGYVIADAIRLVPTGGGGSSGGVFYIHNDHLGTPHVITDGAGDVAWKANYEPFGEVQVVVEAVVNNLRFPGQYYDDETGLHYNYFRTYDPSTGRYLESDPIGLGGGLNTYGYVGGNPLSGIDPYGLDCVAVAGSVTCTAPGGGPTVTFPRPKDWPDTINSDSSNYHSYNIPVPLNGADAACAKQGIINNPTPGSPSPASPQGTLNNATPTSLQSLFNTVDFISSFGNDPGGYNNSPVRSYTTDNGNTVVNVTQPGHPLHPGYVARTINGSQVNNYGEGTARLQGPYSPLAGQINGVWNDQTQGILDSCGCQ